MSLLKKVASSVFGLKGQTPTKFADTASQSKLHYTYSINGQPPINDRRPSNLDLDGQTPSNNYKNNAPEGQSGRI